MCNDFIIFSTALNCQKTLIYGEPFYFEIIVQANTIPWNFSRVISFRPFITCSYFVQIYNFYLAGSVKLIFLADPELHLKTVVDLGPRIQIRIRNPDIYCILNINIILLNLYDAFNIILFYAILLQML